MGTPGISLSPRAVDAIRAGLSNAAEPGINPLLDLLGRERTVPVGEAERSVPREALGALAELGLIELRADAFVPLARLDRVGEHLIASDLRRHRRSPDFVIGPGPASFLLARHVRPDGRGPTLDLGCGSGVQSLLAGGPRTDVVGIDINPRAVRYAAFNAGLNRRPRFSPRLGDFLADEPDRRLDCRFDLVIANPPFVLSPHAELTYRDRTLAGDAVGARTVERVGRALAPGGRGYVLCNWIDRQVTPGSTVDAWLEPVRGWLDGLAHDVVVSRLAEFEPPTYATIWTRDLPAAERSGAITAWTAALDAEGVRRVHLGVIAIGRRRRGAARTPRLMTIDGRPERPSWQAIEALFNQEDRPRVGPSAHPRRGVGW